LAVVYLEGGEKRPLLNAKAGVEEEEEGTGSSHG
jgi:hypothetical protein